MMRRALRNRAYQEAYDIYESIPKIDPGRFQKTPAQRVWLAIPFATGNGVKNPMAGFAVYEAETIRVTPKQITFMLGDCLAWRGGKIVWKRGLLQKPLWADDYKIVDRKHFDLEEIKI